MRTIFYRALVTWPAFTDLVPVERILVSSVLGVAGVTPPSAGDGMWAEVSQNTIDPGIGPIVSARGQLVIYDTPGSYLAVDAAMMAAREALDETRMPLGYGDEWLNVTEWEGVSDDRFDEQFNAIYREATWRLVGRVRTTK